MLGVNLHPGQVGAQLSGALLAVTQQSPTRALKGFLEVSGGTAVESRGFHSNLFLPKADNGLCHGGRLSGSERPNPEGSLEPSNLCSVVPAGGSVCILGARDGDPRWAPAP